MEESFDSLDRRYHTALAAIGGEPDYRLRFPLESDYWAETAPLTTTFRYSLYMNIPRLAHDHNTWKALQDYIGRQSEMWRVYSDRLRQAITSYTANSLKINNLLRGVEQVLDDRVINDIRKIQRVFKEVEPLPCDVFAFRGVAPMSEQPIVLRQQSVDPYERYIQNKSFPYVDNWVGYTSLTFDSSVALSFATKQSNGCCVMRVLIPKGTPALYLDVPESKTHSNGLRELLLPHNTQVVVLGTTQETWSNSHNTGSPLILNVIVVPP
jgi:hypothetical protein